MCGPTATWEYLVLWERDGPDLDALGREGWELVGVAGDDGTARLSFKRPGLAFRERVTIDQKRRHYASWGKTVDERGNLVGGESEGR